MKYRREIDGLRAIAVLPVIFFHAGFTTFSGGFVGVDIFFVISGYLITNLIITDLQKKKFSLTEFYERRARRILPALFFVIIVCLPAAWSMLTPREMKNFSESVISTILFISNFQFWLESGYFDTAAGMKPLLHTWSLAVEEQYYLIFPVFLLLLQRAKINISIPISILAIGSFCLAEWQTSFNPTASFYLLPSRAWEILAGALCAIYMSRSYVGTAGTAGTAGTILGLLLIAIPIFIYDKNTPFPGLYASFPVIGTCLLIICSSQENLCGKILSTKYLTSIGIISYSLYLWHQPIFAFYNHFQPNQKSSEYLALIAITLVISYFSWRFIEQPFRKPSLNKKSPTLIIVLTSSFLLLTGAAGILSNGFENRPHMLAFRDISAPFPSLDHLKCREEWIDSSAALGYCYKGSDTPTALLLGDSHAEDKYHGIKKFSEDYSWGIAGNPSCPPILNVEFTSSDGKKCTEILKTLFSYVATQDQVKLAVLSFSHAYPLNELIAADHINNRLNPLLTKIGDANISEKQKIDAFYLGIENTIKFLEERDIETIIFIDIPELKYLPLHCIKKTVNCNNAVNELHNRQRIHRNKIRLLQEAHPELLVFDPTDIFCPEKICSPMRGNRSLYRDSHHLSVYGSELYGKLFSEWLSTLELEDRVN